MKRFFSLLLVIASISFAGFAAPSEMSPSYYGNSNNLIVITKPPKEQAATFDGSYVVSGYGEQGTVVTMYYLSNGVYKPLYNNDGSLVTFRIGTSLFYKQIDLKPGNTSYACFAEGSNGKTQRVDFSINRLTTSISDSIRQMSVFRWPAR